MKKTIKDKTEALLAEMLDYALSLDLDESSVLLKRSILEIALNYLKVKTDEETGSFFLQNKTEQSYDELLTLEERFGIVPKRGKLRKRKTKEEIEEVEEGGEENE